jgi:hypothetical protein
VDKAANWMDDHPLVNVIPLGLAFFEGNEGAGEKLELEAEELPEALETGVSDLATKMKWPANDGFISGTIKRITLMPGQMIDRYGLQGGKFASPAGTSFEARALRPGSESLPLNTYRVMKPIEVWSGGVFPWFGRAGLGTQYQLPVSISVLLKRGFLSLGQ